jgi:hypothetical protein
MATLERKDMDVNEHCTWLFHTHFRSMSYTHLLKIVTVKYRTIKALFLYFNLCLSVMLDSPVSCLLFQQSHTPFIYNEES